MKPEAAVLTGDLIGSTDAPPGKVEAAMRLLVDMTDRISPSTRFTRYRGDGWQIYLEHPGIGLSSILYIWAGLRVANGLKSRMALGLGAAPSSMQSNALAPAEQQENDNVRPNFLAGDTLGSRRPAPRNALAEFRSGGSVAPHLNALATSGLSGMMGEAFTASGRALDRMSGSQSLAIAGHCVDPMHRRLFAMIDERIAGWSVEQSEAMALAFAPDKEMTQAAMADRLGISRQAVAARLHSGGYTQLAGAAADFSLTFGSGDVR